MFGKLLLKIREQRKIHRYKKWLTNAEQVYFQCERQNEEIIKKLQFKKYGNLQLVDGASAAHIFSEIFLNNNYFFSELKDSRTIVDVGANIGLFSLYARLQAPKSKIFAFEADPNCFAALTKNIELFPNMASTRVLNLCVASEERIMKFYSSSTGGWSSRYQILGAGHATEISVKSVVLSKFLSKNKLTSVDFLKMDIEGGEYDVIMNDADLLDKINIRSIVIEIDKNPRAGKKYKLENIILRLKDVYRCVEQKQSGQYPLFYCTSRR